MEYYVQINGRKTRKQKATGTDNKEEAFKQLEEVLLVARLVEEGKIDLKETNVKTVKTVCKKVIKELDDKTIQKVIYKDYKRKLKDISEFYNTLNIRDLDRLALKKYFNKPFSATQLRISRKAFRLVFEYAEEHNLIEKIPVFPPVEIKKVKEKEDYTDQQIRELQYRYLEKSKSSKNQTARENFKLLSIFINVLNQTGMRFGELKHLRVEDITTEDDQTYFKIRKSKVDSAKRKILVDISINQVIKPIYSKGKKYLFERLDGVLPDFTNIYRGDRDRYIKDFKSAGLEDFTLYNIRDCFIKRKIKENKDIYFIAQYVGSSIEMIQRFYAANFINRNYENIHDTTNDLNHLADMLNLERIEKMETQDQKYSENHNDLSYLFDVTEKDINDLTNKNGD